MKEYSFTTIFTPASEGGYTVLVPALPGCVTEGDTLEEANLMARDAIKCYLESLIADGELIPQEGVKKSEFVTHLSVALE